MTQSSVDLPAPQQPPEAIGMPTLNPTPRGSLGRLLVFVGAAVALNGYLMVANVEREVLGLLAVVDVLLLMALGFHVGLAMLFGGALIILKVVGSRGLDSTLWRSCRPLAGS